MGWTRQIILKLLRLATIFIIACFSLWMFAWFATPDNLSSNKKYSEDRIAKAIAARNVSFDPQHTPTLYSKLKVSAGNESPILKDLVNGGKLPPLNDRVPKEPPVMKGVDGIGNYGGTWMRLANEPNDVGIVTYRLSGPFLYRWSPLGYPLEPNIAKSADSADNGKTWIISLRPGTKWSDGHAFTADDILYWWNEEINNKYISSAIPAAMLINGKPGVIRKIDDFTVEFKFAESYAMFREMLAQRVEFCDTPAHYLRQYHPDPAIGNKEIIDRDLKRYNLPSVRALYTYMKSWQNPEHPRMWPWVYRSYKGNPPQVFVRNPYYYAIDEAGNQLPYIDRLQFDVQDSKMIAITAAAGGVSMQGRHLSFSNYTLLTARSEVAGTHLLHWYPGWRSTWAINPNLNRRVDTSEPGTQWKAQLLSDKRFRKALSVAIDRDKIIRAEQVGIGKPSQVEPGPDSPYHSKKLAEAYVQYDPSLANRMLDEIGLTKRDREGFRTFPDGSQMLFFLDGVRFNGIEQAQFVVDDWQRIGVRTIFRERARSLFYLSKDSMDFDFAIWSAESDYNPMIYPRYFLPKDTESFYAVGWARWYTRGGFYGNPNAGNPGSVPLKPGDPMHESIALYEKALTTPDLPERQKLISQVMDIAAENLWTINISTPPPVPIIVKNGFKNVPPLALWGSAFSTPSNAGFDTYFFEQPQISDGAIAETKAAILQPILRPGKTADGKSTWMSSLIRILTFSIAILLILMVSVRHPFIARRVLIFIPTLAIISVIVFTIIQLPPGDYLSNRIMLLEESGDPSNAQNIEDLKKLFRYEEPNWKLYLRWTGLHWFTTFQASDEGLLQGNLGRSMETQQPINTMVGDRIVLTVVVSLATVLFTWAIALPIGIYSAVKQYSLMDYSLTLIGFIGMCVPSFLLALILMVLADVSGLFSTDYAAQPEWSVGKVIDLMKHIWIPIVVLGVSGTAGMIRIMRANLLDELKKPYVITAMAKGVRPMKLLIKYPVRLALNPFVSGIGGLFPQLVSGGSIVAIVLSLPMIGPQLLQALFTEDMYLAGSMLMVLSLLGVAGTLVSDLLLLWLDPRIRIGGGDK